MIVTAYVQRMFLSMHEPVKINSYARVHVYMSIHRSNERT